MTYSIVARDPATGAMGVAVQSHWFSVGSVVVAASAGLGAIATQANPDLTFKPRGLQLLREGKRAAEVIATLASEDPGIDHRQFAVVDSWGNAVAYTGSACIPGAGQWSGEGYSCQANMMRGDTVWASIGRAFEAASGDLSSRLLAALDGAENAGGDLRGSQSAAILIVPADGVDSDRLVDLRVEDHPAPLVELRRLVRLGEAYAFADRADELLALGDLDGAARDYLAAWGIAPDNVELKFWAGLGLITAGNPQRGREFLAEVIAANADWLELLHRLDPVGVPASIEALKLLAS